MVPEYPLYGQGFPFVIKGGGGAVSLNVIDILGLDVGVGQGFPYGPCSSVAGFIRGHYVRGVATGAAAYNLGHNLGAPFLGVLQFFQYKDYRTLSQNEPVAVGIKRAAGFLRGI